MKVIKFNNKLYEIIEERGDFFYAKDNRGNVKVFAKAKVNIEEINALPQKKYNKTCVSKSSYYDYDHEKMIIIEMAQSTPYSLTEFSDHENASAVIKSIVMQARKNMYISDKQAYVLAKFAEKNNIKLHDAN